MGDRSIYLWRATFLVLGAVALFFGGGAAMDALAHGFHGDFPETLLAVIGAYLVRAAGIVLGLWGLLTFMRAL